MSTPTVTIRVQSETLSDDSSVFNVVVQDGDGSAKFECIDLWHADQLATILRSAIEGYTVCGAKIVHAY